MTEWGYFVFHHLSGFAKLAWYLVADAQLVEKRGAAHYSSLGNTATVEFDQSVRQAVRRSNPLSDTVSASSEWER